MVYDSDFYTSRRYRTPSYTTYTTSSVPTRQIKIYPGLGKIHIVHTYDRIIPYVGHKKITVVTLPPKVYSTRPSILQKEYDWIENRIRPWVAYSPTNRYLTSAPMTTFDDERRLIKVQASSLLKQIHLPVIRIRTWPILPLKRFNDFVSLPARYSNDAYVHRLLTESPNHKVQYATYYTEPVRKYIGLGPLSCVRYVGDKTHNRRRPLTVYEDAIRNDIQLLSYYITKFREQKTQPKEIEAPLSTSRPTRIFSIQKPLEDSTTQELKDLREARAARLAKIYDDNETVTTSTDKPKEPKLNKKEETTSAQCQYNNPKKSKAKLEKRRSQDEEQRRLEEKAAAEEERVKQEQKEKQRQEQEKQRREEEERQRQEKLRLEEEEKRRQEEEKQRLEEERLREEEERLRQEEEERLREAERERQEEEQRLREEEEQRLREEEEQRLREEEERLRLEELARQEEIEKQLALERQRELEEEERLLLEEQKRLDEARAEEERQQLLRLEEIAAQAEEEKEAELARQANELAEIAKQDLENYEQDQEVLNQNDDLEDAQNEEIAQEITSVDQENIIEAEEDIIDEPTEESSDE